ncbi:hypothetical protein C8J56DRAFT_949721 [Mycena floridula]|nr:hypothetical protein C8J56DRAFT_949721 [Mycena floridula]
MPTTILDVGNGSLRYKDVHSFSSTTDLLKLAKFLYSEDVELISLTVAPDNVVVNAIFHEGGWTDRWDALLRGELDWDSLKAPATPISRERNIIHDESKDTWDITQMSVTACNLNDEVKPDFVRGNCDEVSWPATIIRLMQLLVDEGSTIISLVVSKTHFALITNFDQAEWNERFFKAMYGSKWQGN